MKKGVLLVGEPMGLLIAQSEGPLDQVAGYSLAVAGAEFNVAVGLARLEQPVSYMTKLGQDPFGKRIVAVMNENAIGTDFVQYSTERPTGFMLKSRVSRGDPEIFYFRKGSAASTLCEEDVDKIDFSQYQMLHFTGILPALTESTRRATYRLVEKARAAGLLVSFDPNLRPQLWPDRETMVATVNKLASLADMVLPGEGEGETLCGSRDPEKISDFYLGLGAKTVVTKVGSEGAYLAQGRSRELVPGFQVEKVVDTMGAGDGFAAGVLSALLEGQPMRDAVRRGNAVGAIQVMSRGDNDGLPRRAGLADFMGVERL